jgi:hypothetical protein
MARQLKLDDLHLILLSTASQRDDGNVLPVAVGVAAETERVSAALAQLLQHKLVEEVPTTSAPFWREDGDDRYMLVLTETGHAALGIAPVHAEPGLALSADAPSMPQTGEVVAAPSLSEKATSKSATVVALMQRADGATLDELVAATDWLPHTTRAALTGLRKKGHVIERSKRGDETCYRIAAAA